MFSFGGSVIFKDVARQIFAALPDIGDQCAFLPCETDKLLVKPRKPRGLWNVGQLRLVCKAWKDFIERPNPHWRKRLAYHAKSNPNAWFYSPADTFDRALEAALTYEWVEYHRKLRDVQIDIEFQAWQVCRSTSNLGTSKVRLTKKRKYAIEGQVHELDALLSKAQEERNHMADCGHRLILFRLKYGGTTLDEWWPEDVNVLEEEVQ